MVHDLKSSVSVRAWLSCANMNSNIIGVVSKLGSFFSFTMNFSKFGLVDHIGYNTQSRLLYVSLTCRIRDSVPSMTLHYSLFHPFFCFVRVLWFSVSRVSDLLTTLLLFLKIAPFDLM